jgi:hypothetical protein
MVSPWVVVEALGRELPEAGIERGGEEFGAVVVLE